MNYKEERNKEWVNSTFIQPIEQAIDDAQNMKSKLKPENFDVPALTSLRIRHLLNNIGALGNKYMEIGVHRGGCFTSAISYNQNLKYVYAIDNFESDKNGEHAQTDFIDNTTKFLPENTTLELIVSDSFEVDTKKLPGNIDIYLYDAGHSEEDQRKALTYYINNLNHQFIYLCDDYDWDEVQKGTQDGIKECNLEILFEKHLVSAISREQGGHDNDSWWNGFYVSLLKKKTHE